MKALTKASSALISILVCCASHAASYSIPDTGIAFEAPEGYSPLSKEEIGIKFPRSTPPGFVVGNERRTTTIAFDIKPDRVPADQLPELEASFESMFESMIPSLVWKERKLIDFQGRRSIYFEMTTKAADTDIYNIMLVTPLERGTALFNFNSTKAEFPKVEAALRASLQTIRFQAK